MTATQDSLRSSHREMLIEHLWVGEIMKFLWLRGVRDLEVLRPEVDDSGYDLVLEARNILRHVQLKSSFDDAKTARVNVSMKLAQKPSGCVVWVRFNPRTLRLGPFFYFGGAPGQPLPDISAYEVSKHAKGNAQGVKLPRAGLRVVKRRHFKQLIEVDDLVAELFGAFNTG